MESRNIILEFYNLMLLSLLVLDSLGSSYPLNINLSFYEEK